MDAIKEAMIRAQDRGDFVPADIEHCSHCGCHPDDAQFRCPLQIGRWGQPCHGESAR